MRLRCLAIAVAVPFVPSLPASLCAQEPIRVVRHNPVDIARPGEAITISFDRPIVGSLERTPDPYRIVRFDPPIDARVQWRDPTTLRIVPRSPLVPGRRYGVRLSNDFEAIDGGRLPAPYQFTLAIAGPRLVASMPALDARPGRVLEPNGRIRLVYSAPIDSALIDRVARFTGTDGGSECAGRTFDYAVRSQRRLVETDDYPLRSAGSDRDSLEASFRRLVELRPVSPIPAGCHGTFVLPSLDPADRSEITYPLATFPAFRIQALSCVVRDCAGEQVTLTFTAPVFRDSLVRHLRLEPQMPFTVSAGDGPSHTWALRLRVAPRTTYRVHLAPELTDVYARRLTGSATAVLTTRDRNPALGHQLGFFTVSRSNPVLRVTHVNVDSADIAIIAIPDSLRMLVLTLSYDPDSIARTIARLRDTLKLRVTLRAPFNEERVTEIPLPAAIRSNVGGSLFAIRASMPPTPVTISDTRRVPGEQPAIQILGSTSGPSIRTAIVQLTDLMVHAKVFEGSGTVFVTDAKTGRPIRGARVTTRDRRDQVIATARTDTTGIASLVALRPRVRPVSDWRSSMWGYRSVTWESDARLVEVAHGSDRSVLNTAGTPWSYTTLAEQLGAVAYDPPAAHAFVFTDRGIYRPNETIYVSSIVRVGDLAGLRVPNRGDSIRLEVSRTEPGEPGARVVRKVVLPLTSYGTAVDSFSLSRAAALGDYDIAVETFTTAWTRVGGHSFRLAEYRAPEFEATVAIDSGVRFLGDTLTARAKARYYFGAPMAGAVLRWTAVTSDAPGGVAIPGLPAGFRIGASFSRDGSPPQRYEAKGGVDTLDAAGAFTLRLPTTLGTSSVPARVEIDVAVDDVSRQSVSVSESALLHASRFYVAVRDSSARGWYWSENVPRRMQVLAVRPDGQRVSNVGVRVAIVRHHMRFIPRFDGSSPTAAWSTDTVSRQEIVTRDSIVSFTFTPRDVGWHELIFRSADDRGTELRTTIGAYVAGRQWTPWGNDPSRIAMSVDSSAVAPGDTLTVRFVSPFPQAEAWVSVERENVLAERRMRVPAGETVVRVPVTDEFIPGAQVSVLLVDAGVASLKDSLHHRYRAAYSTIYVDRTSKTLAVDVRPERSRYAPGDSARVSVAVRNHRKHGVSANVTLWAVDEAVLALDGYTLPEPVAAIHSARGTALRFSSTLGTLASLGRQLSPAGWMHISGRASLSLSAVTTATAARASIIGDESVLRSDFRTTAFFLGNAITDSAGNLSVAIKLPDNLTTYRVMAVAVTSGDAYGSGESAITLTKPLIARPALPRFLRTGDALLAGSVINNTTSDRVDARVSAAGSGIVRTGDTTLVRRVAAGRGAEARFHWRADGQPGDSASFRFDARGGEHRDVVEVTLPMRAPYAPRYHAIAGVSRGRSSVRMMLPRDIDPKRSRLTLRVGTSPVPIIQAAYARAEVYPYECSEQLTSTGQVILAMLQLQRAGLLDPRTPPDSATLRTRLQYVVDELTRRQSRDGGIGYWTAGSWTDTWLSSYAGTLLIDARAAGLRVDSMAILGIAAFIESIPNRGTTEEPEHGTRAERDRAIAWTNARTLAALHFLRRAGLPDTAGENQLVGASSRMVWEDRVWLAELLGARHDKSAARAQLASVWRDVEIAGIRVDVPDSLLATLGFRSHVRPVARLLRATMLIDPVHDRVGALVERIVQQGRAERQRYWNTQDYAELSRTLADLAIAQRAAGPAASVSVRSARRSVSGRPLLEGSGTRQSESTVTLDGLLERDGEWMAMPLEIVGSDAPTFYVLTVDEVPLVPPKKPDARGLIVERWFERYDNGRPVTEVTEGDLVRGRLRITVPSDREFVAVEDLLPAGLEVVDLSLNTSGLGPFDSAQSREAFAEGNRIDGTQSGARWLYGSWTFGWWTPWEHQELRDDRVMYFARMLWKGVYSVTYVARATTVGTFVRPPAHAEEMYNPSVAGRSDGSVFRVLPKQ